MSPPEVWGPAVWSLFHTLAEKINVNAYPYVFPSLFNMIVKICRYLPCPECSQHAKHNLAGVNIEKLKTKGDLINVLFIFHNSVNKRKNKLIYNFSEMDKYANNNLLTVCNNFFRNYKTTGNMRLMAESYQRKMIVENFIVWLKINYKSFM